MSSQSSTTRSSSSTTPTTTPTTSLTDSTSLTSFFPAPTESRSSPGEDGNGGGGSPPTASSASLYRTLSTTPSSTPTEHPNSRLTRRPINEIAVYTFLATLVLLLSVSAAIVIRSFILRRRHRRMIEEAIRNGTWIPPAPGGRGPRVDLSKKPKIWETYLDLNQEDVFQHNTMVEEKDWESIKPVMAGYVKYPITNGSSNGTAPVVASNGNERDENIEGQTGRTSDRDLRRRIRNIFERPGSLFRAPRYPVSNGTRNNSRHGSAVDVGNQEMPMSEISPEPQRVRVAVLVAMPRPHHSQLSSSSSSSSTQPSPHPANSDEEERLPHLEMGVAELVLVSEQSLSHLNTTANNGGKGKLRESMASSASV